MTSEEAPFSATSCTSSLGHMTNPSAFGELWMECKLQTVNAERCVSHLPITAVLLTHVAMQLWSFSYLAASDIIAGGLTNGQVELWQTGSQGTSLTDMPSYACVRERLARAEAQANDIKASIEKAGVGFHHKMSREQELKHSIADLEAKCTHIPGHAYLSKCV